MKLVTILIGFILTMNLLGQENSVLASGQWVKIETEEKGVYKISRTTLQSMGFDLSNLDPRDLVLYGIPEGMLPQANDANWPINLEQLPIEIIGEEDGSFDEGDLILFYASGPDKLTYDESVSQYSFQKNLYASKSYYYLSIANSNGLRVSQSIDLGRGFPSFSTHQKLIIHESEEFNLLSSGREWFGERMTNNSLRFDFSNDQIIEGTGTIHVSAIAQSFNSSSLTTTVNNNASGVLEFFSIPNQQYAVKADAKNASFTFSSINNSLSIEFTYDRNGSNSATSYLDNFLVEAPASNKYSSPFLLTNSDARNSSISEFQIESDQIVKVWNVTRSNSPISQELIRNGGISAFSAFSDQVQLYWVFNESSVPEANNFESIANQNLQGETVPQLIIIAHSQFMTHAEQMAEFRRSNDNMTTLVVNVKDIYNEYSAGRQDITAIRNFIKQKYDQSNELQYVLLFGKGSYDYKNRLNNNSNFVPTYESRNSIHPLFSYSSDDFFGFLEDHEGDWIEDRSGDHTLDIGIGRIPVTTVEQADSYLQKWFDYQSKEKTLGNWRGRVAFVADDGDRNIHQRDADILANRVDQSSQQFNLSKLYLDAFYQEDLPNGERSFEAEEALLSAVNNGTLLINFTGHGAESGWMQERILTFDLMEQWNNPNTLPFLVTATCEFGRNDDPSTLSGAEFLLNKPRSGAIGLVTTARPVFSSTNFSLNQALYDVILNQENGLYYRLGDIIQYTKNNSLEGSLNRNFILLGDPSMRLSYPEKQINLTHINNRLLTKHDTIRAFDKVIIQGSIMTRGTIDSEFNGGLTYEFLDKPSSKKTYGTESPVFNFKEKDRSLSRGQVSVVNGQFEIDLQVSQNIDYSFGNGRLQFYAIDSTRQIDAIGVYEDLILGGTSSNNNTDNTAPVGSLFLNDVDSGILKSYSESVLLIAQLQDESGINISDNSLGQNIELIINDSISYNLNSYFNNQLDRSDQGWLQFSVEELSPGLNTFLLKFWDNNGNPGEAEISFLVEENSSLINEINNYPNPLRNETSFVVSHKLAGEDLDVKVEIINSNGQPITAISQQFNRAQSNLQLNWKALNNWGTQLEKGVYIYNIQINSRTSGLKDSKRKKLVISY